MVRLWCREIIDEQAVCEEFTFLPALVVVVIGFTLFLLILSSTEENHQNQINSIDNYNKIIFIKYRLLSLDTPLMDNGAINYSYLISGRGLSHLEELRREISRYNLNFSLHLTFNDQGFYIPSKPLESERIAISQPVAVKTNDVEVSAGRLTIILWEDK